jgi:hypothetical protein
VLRERKSHLVDSMATMISIIANLHHAEVLGAPIFDSKESIMIASVTSSNLEQMPGAGRAEPEAVVPNPPSPVRPHFIRWGKTGADTLNYTSHIDLSPPKRWLTVFSHSDHMESIDVCSH